MPGPFTEVVIGATDIGNTVEFLGLFGLTEQSPAGEGTRLHHPQATANSSVLVLPAEPTAANHDAYAHGPRALDVYTADIAKAVGVATGAGYTVSPEAVIEGGPMRMAQVMVTGPDALKLVLVQSTHRRSSTLDAAGDELFSEPHSVVWVVADQVAETARFDSVDWTVGAGISFEEPTVSDEMDLPDRPTPISMNMVSDAGVGSIRLELMTFDDHTGDTPTDSAPPDLKLHPGICALAYEVESALPEIDKWGTTARFSSMADAFFGDRTPAVLGTTSGGVRFILRERGRHT